MEQAAEKFTFITDPARRPAAAAAALKRYQDYQAVATCYNVDLRSATSPGFAQGSELARAGDRSRG
eukprot:4737488-Pleurochrysis_carterae.AAC.2